MTTGTRYSTYRALAGAALGRQDAAWREMADATQQLAAVVYQWANDGTSFNAISFALEVRMRTARRLYRLGERRARDHARALVAAAES